MTNYTISEHVHRYACWAAARAASVSRFSNMEIADFINAVNLREELKLMGSHENLTPLIYKARFIMQVNSILRGMEAHAKKDGSKFRNYSFGIAAKIVSIYTKTAGIIPSGGTSRISCIAFPPIDSYLLKGLKKKMDIKNTVWSKMDEREYIDLIEKLKQFMGDHPFWKLEKYWDLNLNQ